jgi:hypothetical protein
MPKNNLHADRILPGLGVIEQDIAAGMLDVAAKRRRAVDSAFLAHEADSAFAIDDKTPALRDSRTKTVFHRSLTEQPQIFITLIVAAAELIQDRLQVALTQQSSA